MWLRRLLVLIGLLSSVTFTHAQIETPDAPARDSILIAFDYQRDLYITDFESPPINLTNSETDEIMPLWSPDGREIAFLSAEAYQTGGDARLSVMTLETGEIRQLSDLQLSSEVTMSWSPDGRFIAVALSALFVVDANSGEVRRLTVNSSASSDPTWSPDGLRLVFRARGPLYTIEPDGQNLQHIESAPENSNHPVFSPVSNDVIFLASGEDGPGIYRLNTEDMTVTNVVTLAGYESYRLHWSPDGQSIAFELFPAFESEVVVPGGADVYVMNADGSAMRSVTGDSRDSFVGWLPDSKQLIYWAGEPGGASGSFYRVNILDSSRVLLSDETLETMCSYNNCPTISVRP